MWTLSTKVGLQSPLDGAFLLFSPPRASTWTPWCRLVLVGGRIHGHGAPSAPRRPRRKHQDYAAVADSQQMTVLGVA